MIMISLFSLVLTMSFILLLVSQPLSMGSLVLVNSMVISVTIFFQTESWFGFILFLIYVGGLLVMFAYVTALTPNLVFKKGQLKFVFFLVYFFWLSLFMGSDAISVSSRVGESFLSSGGVSVYHEQGMSLYSFFGFLTTVSLVLVLLFVLLCVVKICYKKKGALRPFS
uniref:NADH-ubiquinone oxidoreductase chain 6 n=1 Tax=Acanthopleura vaillantii TaxID=1169768 RepID=A0AA51RIK8_9MOLL|nr:NADH dehydrogenase subunit 6 [Acanthopleura vaillantii]WMQ53040.1 NADH dehydrogenase subunit 6 [Acanthopleura vaillantii]